MIDRVEDSSPEDVTLEVCRIAEATAVQDLVIARANAAVALADLRAELGQS